MNTWVSRLHTLIGSDKDTPVPERRYQPRYRVQIDVTVVSHGRPYHARTIDMGQDGMGVYLSADLALGEQVLLNYELGDGSPPKKIPGVVCDRNGTRYAIAFGA